MRQEARTTQVAYIDFCTRKGKILKIDVTRNLEMAIFLYGCIILYRKSTQIFALI